MLRTKIEKLEESLLNDTQITTIIVARRCYAKWIRKYPVAEALQKITENCPEVPHYLLTAQLYGRLLEAEKKTERDQKIALNWNTATAEKNIRRLIANTRSKHSDVSADEIISCLKTYAEFAEKVDFEKLRQEIL